LSAFVLTENGAFGRRDTANDLDKAARIFQRARFGPVVGPNYECAVVFETAWNFGLGVVWVLTYFSPSFD
jgi:hypothetical protein